MLSTNTISTTLHDDRSGAGTDTATSDFSQQTLRAGTAHDLGNLIQVALSSFHLLARDPTVLTSSRLGPLVAAGALTLNKAGAMVRQRDTPLPYVQPQHSRTDVRDCIQELADLFRTTWEPGHFSIDLNLEPNLPEAECDPQGLQNAVLNLVLNARDAMPDGGVIAIDVVTVSRSGLSSIQVSVRDHGLGMTEETMHRAFEPFFTTKGTGLGGVGLPMVRHFVESHGGTVRLESVPTEGTTVILDLPGIAPVPTGHAILGRKRSDKG